MKKAAKRGGSSGQVRRIVLDKLKQEAKRPMPKSGRPLPTRSKPGEPHAS